MQQFKLQQLNLLLPGMVWPEAADRDYLLKQLQAPQLAKLLPRATKRFLPASYADFYYHAEDYSQGSLARSWAAKLGLIASYAHYLIVEPTHLRADRDRLLIAESELLQLNNAEALSIIAAINQHFAGEVQLNYLNDEMWLLGVNLDLSDFICPPLINIVGENIDDYLPQGKSRLAVHKLLNEIQMLLFSLPLNLQRDSEGLLTVNSVWLWDKHHQLELPLNLGQVCSNNPRFGAPVADFTNSRMATDTLWLDHAYYPSCYRDAYAWVAAIEQLEQQLLPQLMTGLQSGQYKSLQLCLPLTTGVCKVLRLKRSSLWRIWRRPSLNELFDSCA